MTIDEYKKRINSKGNKVSYRDSLIRRTFITVIVVLLVLIVGNISNKFSEIVKEYLFQNNYNFAKINSLYNKYVLNVKDKNKESVVSVSSNIEYYSYKEVDAGVLLSVSENYNVKMLESGLVVFIGEKDGRETIIVQQSNGIDVIYGNVHVYDIKVYDYLEKGTIIGVSNNELYLRFEKEGELVDYKTYIE